MKFFALFALTCAAAWAQGAPRLCSGRVPVTLTASGDTTVVIPTSGQGSIHACLVSLSFASGVDLTFKNGSTAISGVYKNVATFNVNFAGELVTAKGSNLVITLGTAVTGGGFISYYEVAQ